MDIFHTLLLPLQVHTMHLYYLAISPSIPSLFPKLDDINSKYTYNFENTGIQVVCSTPKLFYENK